MRSTKTLPTQPSFNSLSMSGPVTRFTRDRTPCRHTVLIGPNLNGTNLGQRRKISCNFDWSSTRDSRPRHFSANLDYGLDFFFIIIQCRNDMNTEPGSRSPVPETSSNPSPVVFCPLLKKSSGNPYLKILDFSQLLIADTPIIFFLLKKFSLHPLRALLGHPVQI